MWRGKFACGPDDYSLVFAMNAPSENSQRLSLPHAVEAEREILAAALVDPNSVDTIIEHEIGEEDFYVSRHGMVFAAMRRVHERHGTIDEVTLAQQMKDMGCLLYTSPSPRDATLSRMPSSA